MKGYKGLGLKPTPQRTAILDYLNGNKEHPSAYEIYKAVSRQFPTMSFATVYNTLEVLKKRGDILELTIDPDKKRFDPNTDAHHHMICISCKKIIDIRKNYRLAVPKAETGGFKLIGNHIEFYGVCPMCKK